MKRTSLLSLPFAALLVLCAAPAASGMYHPTLGRFVQRDPVEYGDTGNMYEYVASQPAAATDAMGMAATVQTLTDIRKAGSAAFGKTLPETMSATCDKCCVEAFVGPCKQEAKKIAEMIRKTWEFNYGRPGAGRQRSGGYYCWDWSLGFATAARSVKPEQWSIKEVMARDKDTPTQLHYYVRMEACVCEKRKKGQDGKDVADCSVMVDDGFIGGTGYVHTGDWMSTGWDRSEEGKEGFIRPVEPGPKRRELNSPPQYTDPKITPPGPPRRMEERKFEKIFGQKP